jgi:hypothetical protein
VNPRIGCGVQQTRETRDGANRQGGEKPWRRNRTCPCGNGGPMWTGEGKPSKEHGSGRHELVSMEGIFENPMRGAWRKPGRESEEASSSASFCGEQDLDSERRPGGNVSREQIVNPQRFQLPRERPATRKRGHERPRPRRQGGSVRIDVPRGNQGEEGMGSARFPHALSFL